MNIATTGKRPSPPSTVGYNAAARPSEHAASIDVEYWVVDPLTHALIGSATARGPEMWCDTASCSRRTQASAASSSTARKPWDGTAITTTSASPTASSSDAVQRSSPGRAMSGR